MGPCPRRLRPICAAAGAFRRFFRPEALTLPLVADLAVGLVDCLEKG